MAILHVTQKFRVPIDTQRIEDCICDDLSNGALTDIQALELAEALEKVVKGIREEVAERNDPE